MYIEQNTIGTFLRSKLFKGNAFSKNVHNTA